MEQAVPLSADRFSRWRWLWLLPRLAFALFVGGVGLLLWMSDQSDREERRATLISDVLWLEQNLRFHLSRNEELLGRISRTHTSDPVAFEAFAHSLFGYESGLRQLIWLDPEGKIRLAYPSTMDPSLVGDTGETVPSRQSYRLAKSIGKPVYSRAYPYYTDDWQFEVHVPVSHGGHVIGIAVGIYRIRELLNDSVPWWLAERYRISVVTDGGKVLGTRSKVKSPVVDEGYRVPFDPPGWDLALLAVPYHAPRPAASLILSAALLVLASIVLWSLWILRRHVLRRQSVEEELRREHAFRKAMEDSLDSGMRARNLDGEIIYVNPSFCRMVGWSAEELVGMKPPMPYWADDYLAQTQSMHDRVLAGEGPEEGFELKFKRRDGKLIDVLIHETPLMDLDGKHFGWMGSMIDITERKRAEEAAREQHERLQSTARLVAVGEMASSIAHELNQPLAAISSYCTGAANMLRGQEGTPEIVSALDKAVDQSRRAAQVIRRIYSLTRPNARNFEALPLARHVSTAITLVGPEIRQRGVRVHFAQRAEPVIEGDPVLIEQLLVNLFRNALDSMKETPADRRVLEIDLSVSDGYAALDIRDQGCGIDKDVAEKMFDPLFSTKPEGMGMGLAICRSVVEHHKGRLSFVANPAGGSICQLLFPLPAA